MKELWPSLVLSAALAGCATAPAAPEPFLPQLDPPPPGLEEVFLTGSFAGVLVIDQGCVRVKSRVSGEIHTVLWHRGTELSHDAQGYFLRNSHTGSIYRFGEAISFGGGAMRDEAAEANYPDAVRLCGPPYAKGWLSG